MPDRCSDCSCADADRYLPDTANPGGQIESRRESRDQKSTKNTIRFSHAFSVFPGRCGCIQCDWTCKGDRDEEERTRNGTGKVLRRMKQNIEEASNQVVEGNRQKSARFGLALWHDSVWQGWDTFIRRCPHHPRSATKAA